MRSKRRLSKKELRSALRERLHYLAFKARREPKSLTLSEIDELCEIIVVLGPPKDAKDPPEPWADSDPP